MSITHPRSVNTRRVIIEDVQRTVYGILYTLLSFPVWDWLNRAIDQYTRVKSRIVSRIRARKPKGVTRPKFYSGKGWEQIEYHEEYWFRTSKQWFWRKIKSPYVASRPADRTFIGSDETDQRFLSHADGKYYSSKSAYRAELKAHGYTEVGNERDALYDITRKTQEQNRAIERQQFRNKFMEVAHRL